MNVESDIPSDNLKEEKSINLQSAISALSSETGNLEFLENIKTCMSFMSTFNISNIDQQLLQWVLPALKNTIQKAFDEIFLLSDTSEDEFVLNELRENLKLILQLLEILKEVLEFIAEIPNYYLYKVKNVVVVSVQVISSIFDHCRKSAEPLKKHLNDDLINIFNIMQSIHQLYFQVLEHCELASEVKIDVDILLEVLDNLCTISENLFYLNTKSLAINWKGYLSIVIKFSDVLKHQVDLKRPVLYLTSLICDNLSSAKDRDTIQSTTQTIQLSRFFVKVVLKLFGIFWDNRKQFINDIMEFCCAVYSFTPNKFLSMELSMDIAKLVDDEIFQHTKPFVLTFFLDDLFPQVITNEKFISGKHCFGFLNLLNACFEILTLHDENGKCNLETLVQLIFQCVKNCYGEFFWSQSYFDDLVINISAAIMTHDSNYGKVEIILLENILQEEIINNLLATEIWCLLLRNSNPHFCVETLINLIKKYSQLDFGKNTHRLEHVYLLSLIQRVFRILPDYLKSQIVQSVHINKDVWKRIGFINFGLQMSTIIIEGIYSDTLEQIEQMKSGDFSCRDLVLLVENLKCLSTVNYEEMNISHMSLVNAIDNVWKLEFTDMTNNVFRYFIVSFCKITTNFLMEFNNKQLHTILNQQTHLSTIDSLKIHICIALKRFCNINDNKLGQDACLLYKTFSNVLSNILLKSNNVIKQNVLEILEILTKKGKYDVVRDVLSGCATDRTLQDTISDFLRKKFNKTSDDVNYFKNLGGSKQKHACVEWKKEDNSCSKKIKLDIVDTVEVGKLTEQNTKDKDAVINRIKGKLNSVSYKPSRKENSKLESKQPSEDDDNIDEVLSRIKGEVKCLLKVLKTDKLSTKNASDLKIITNQLLSLM